MAFPEDFWIATSTAAPVIALAVVVALPDAATVISKASSVWNEVDEVQHEHRIPTAGKDSSDHFDFDHYKMKLDQWIRLTTINWWTAIVNIIAQAGLLAVSLSSLAYSRDLLPLWVAIVLAVAGLLDLAWIVVIGDGINKSVPQVSSLLSRWVSESRDPAAEGRNDLPN